MNLDLTKNQIITLIRNFPIILEGMNQGLDYNSFIEDIVGIEDKNLIDFNSIDTNNITEEDLKENFNLALLFYKEIANTIETNMVYDNEDGEYGSEDIMVSTFKLNGKKYIVGYTHIVGELRNILNSLEEK